MKLRFDRQQMSDALTAINSVAPVRTPKEVLKCVLLEATPDVLHLSATDLEVGLRVAVTKVEVGTKGSVLVVADTLARIVRECPDEVLTIEAADQLLHIRGAGSQFRIVTHDPTGFPPVPTAPEEPDVRIEHGQLCRLIELTVFAAAKENTRYAIIGVLWEVTGNRLTLAATDGRRLSVASGPLQANTSKRTAQAIIPPKALSLLQRLPIEAEATVGIMMTSNQLLLKLDRACVSTSLVEGQFPRYQDVIPSDCDCVASLQTAEFLGALRQASLLTNEESKGVRFTFENGSLMLRSRAPEQGEAEIRIPVAYKGHVLEIGFNPGYLLDVLRVVHTEGVTFAVKEAQRPGVLRVGEDFVYVIMPVNLSSG